MKSLPTKRILLNQHNLKAKHNFAAYKNKKRLKATIIETY